ncbi:MAG: metallophosphoesterase [Pseudomonadota bacterium]
MPAETRIAQLTDPHLPFGLPRGIERLGKRGLSWISWMLRRRRLHQADVAEALLDDLLSDPHDLVAMTGDLINFGLPREFEASRAWLESLGPPEQVLAIPGNHEALAGDWEGEMHRHWEGYAGQGRILVHGGVALIGVSSACTTLPFFASGEVARAELDALSRDLDAARDAGLIPVVAIHHPPTDLTVRRKALRNLPETVEVIAKGGAALVLHGHTHRRELSWIDAPHGRIPVLGAASLSMTPGHPSAPGAWRSFRIWREGDEAQIEMRERTIAPDLRIHSGTPVRLRIPVLA